MIKQILINEIKDVIGHQPSSAEYKSALAYLSDNIASNHNFTDLALLLCDWRDDELVRCQECGGYFLPDAVEERETPWNCFRTVRVCSDECFNDYCQFNEPEKPEISQYI